MSETERVALQRSLEEAERIKSELSSLRRNANLLRARPYFLQNAKNVLQGKNFSLEDSFKLETTALDSSKRSKLISDVINSFADEWLECVKDSFFRDADPQVRQSFEESYRESTYHKGIVGGKRERGEKAFFFSFLFFLQSKWTSSEEEEEEEDPNEDLYL